MASLRADKGRLFIDFIYRGHRCRESLHLADNRENRIVARQLIRRIEAELALGTFDYAATFPRSRKAEKFSERRKRDVQTLGEFARNWLESRRPSLKPATYYDYSKLLHAHILRSKLAMMPIILIRPSDIRAFVAELYAKRTDSDERKLGPRRMNMVRDRLYGIFAAALEDGIVSENPVARVDRLREPVPDVDPLTFDEVQSLLAEANEWERSLLTVLCFTGLRPNEALALRWDDLDFDRNQILIRLSLSRYGLGEPKTPGSVRTIDMLPPVRDALLAQRPRAQLRSEFVSPNEDGGPLDETNFRDRNWRRLLRRAGLRYRPLYHCRHTYAVLELSHGESPLYVARQLGHTTPETTLRRYARFMRRVPRTGTLASRFTAELRQKAIATAGTSSDR